MIETGCDIIAREAPMRLKGKRTGLLANPASVTRDFKHVSEALVASGVELVCLFGPQHGYRGETQANMIEWESYAHPVLEIPVYSLYGGVREPTPSMLEGVEAVVIDLQDVGARPYTYLWTAVLVMRACAGAGVEVTVLDRPNPLGGWEMEGPLLDEGYSSFVGLHALPMRHGLTIGEALGLVGEREGTAGPLDVVKMKGWERRMCFGDTALPWVPPSPNMPTPETAVVYPGTVLLEGTNISEGRGTTRPFEIIGAPWIDPVDLSRSLADSGIIEGAVLRPLYFEPTWDKYAGELCGGFHVHVLDRSAFKPVRFGASVIQRAAAMYPEHFRWSDPPYEYERKRAPIDIICGGDALRRTVEAGDDLERLFGDWKRDEESFERERTPFLLYR